MTYGAGNATTLTFYYLNDMVTVSDTDAVAASYQRNPALFECLDCACKAVGSDPKQPPTPTPTPSPTDTPTLSPSPSLTTTTVSPSKSPTLFIPCDPSGWVEVKNGEICTELSDCSALINFADIVQTNCREFCTSYGLDCDDADDEIKNKCNVFSRTSDQHTCDTAIDSEVDEDAICYCSNSPMPTPLPTPSPTSRPTPKSMSAPTALPTTWEPTTSEPTTSEPTTSEPTPSTTAAPTSIAVSCDPSGWVEVKNGEICTELSDCSALINFADIVQTNCREFCTSYGLDCDDADDEIKNKCNVFSRTSDQHTCDTAIDSEVDEDAICYCSNSPMPTPLPTPSPTSRPTPKSMSAPTALPTTWEPTTSEPATSTIDLPLMLIDASTFPATDLYELNGSSVLYLDSIGTDSISMRFEHDRFSNEPPGSVLFAVNGDDGSFTHLETSAPYSLLGDRRGGRQYVGWNPAAGVFTLTVTAYAGDGTLLRTYVSTLLIETVSPVAQKLSANTATATRRKPSGSGDAQFDATAVVVGTFAGLILVTVVYVVVVIAAMRYSRQRRAEPVLEIAKNELDQSFDDQEAQSASFVGLAEETENNFDWDDL